MTNNIIQEIKEFKQLVSAGGMTFEYYKQRSSQIKHKIDVLIEEKLKILRCLLFFNKITREQYMDFKLKIEQTRKHYKGLLSI